MRPPAPGCKWIVSALIRSCRLRSKGGYQAALRAARAVAAAAPELLPGTAGVVRGNLRLALGKAPPKLVRAVYRHFAEAMVDLLFFERLFDPSRFGEHFRFDGGGLEHYRKSRPDGGAVFVTGHFGNWELYGAAFRFVGIPIAPIARPQGKGWFNTWLERFRRDQGQEIIPKQNALPLALKALRRGTNVAFLIDQAAGYGGVPIPFFGQPAYTHVAPASLAIKLDLPLYAGYSTRLGDGICYRCFAEQVPLTSDPVEVMGRVNALLEGYVRDRPEQWWWFHRRFKIPRSQRGGAEPSPAGASPVAQ
ncbi:MAG: lysophospholipid acyltransferase family protein [Planctomycetota bacterium]